MDDFEYSVHISDQDWDCFFQECENCDLLSPVLASREDSGMSDIDEMGCLLRSRTLAVGTASTDPDPDLQIDGPQDGEGSPVCNYLSKYGIRSPEQVLSGSEEDLHLQTVNLFFEQLKSVTENQQPSEQSHVIIHGSEKTGHLEGLIDKQELLSGPSGQSGQNKSYLRGDITKQGAVHTWGVSEKSLGITSAYAQESASKSDTELVIGRKLLTTPLITVRMKQGRCSGLSKDLQLITETKPPDKGKMVVVNRKDVFDPYAARQNIAQLDGISSSDSKDSPIGQIPVSPSRRKRRKKKRISVEPAEQGHEAQFHYQKSESEEERFIQREEVSNLPGNVWRTEQLSLQRITTPLIAHNTDHLQLRNTFDLEGSADFKFSNSLPVSFTSNLGTTPPKQEVGHISFNTIAKSMHDTSLVNNGQLKTKICELSLLPQIDEVPNVKESGLNITESLQFDPAVHLRESRNGITETLSAPLSDISDAGCQRKSLISPSVSIDVESTEPPSSIASFKLTEDKDLSGLANEIDCSPLKIEQTIPSNVVEISATEERILTGSTDRAESSSDGNSPENFTCSQEASQQWEVCIHENVSESQNHLAAETIEINTDIPVSETNAKTESYMSDNINNGADESLNKTSEVLIANASSIEPRNSDELADKRDISDNQVAVLGRNNSEQLVFVKSIISSDPTDGMLTEESTQDISEFPQNMVAEIKDTSSSELNVETKDLESVSPEASNQLQFPVFAISSFWNEMEKLTINDILRLRMISNAPHPSILTLQEDGSIADTTDAADSGYFTQLDDSKPDRSSGDMSYISDLDEDLAQLQTPSPSKQEDESSELSNTCGVMWVNESDPVIVADEIVHISPETTLPEHLYTANAQQCLRRMCKNMSVQNLQALDTQPIRQILRNASMHSIHSEVDDDFIDPFYHLNTSGSKIFSDDEEEIENNGITFSEIVNYFFGEDEPERCASRADNVAASYLDGSGTSLPENYDHFFSEFDSGNFVFPIMEESGDKMVQIFSCSRSANRNLQFPEAYDYFFPDSPVSSDEDDENDNAAIKVVTRFDYKSPNHDPVDMYEHFLSEDESDFLWTNPLSLRKVRRTGFNVPKGNICSGELVPVKTFSKGIMQPINAMSPDGSPFPDSLLFNLENRIFLQLAEQQKKCMEMQTVIADPRLDAPFLPLKQADMCLVCIAFASWVLKSSGSGGDTWKAALLANISALSAIRYLRRHKREEVSGKTPLRQIEPA